MVIYRLEGVYCVEAMQSFTVSNAEDYAQLVQLLHRSAEDAYRVFVCRLCTTCAAPVLGVRMPILQKLAKELAKGDVQGYFACCRMDSYEEQMLCGLVLAVWRVPFSEKEPLLHSFIRKIDNWAVCDSFCAALRVQPQEEAAWFAFGLSLLETEGEYTRRTGVVLLRHHFLTAERVDAALPALLRARGNPYYVSMAIAWYLSDCFVRFPEKVLPLLQEHRPEGEIQNLTIRKCLESRRVSEADKKVLRSLKRM